MTTPGVICGDQMAGWLAGSAEGEQGKAKAPPLGQALQFTGGLYWIAPNPCFGFGVVTLICGIAPQEFLREVGRIMIAILISGRR
jgi:hypothetical protein